MPLMQNSVKITKQLRRTFAMVSFEMLNTSYMSKGKSNIYEPVIFAPRQFQSKDKGKWSSLGHWEQRDSTVIMISI